MPQYTEHVNTQVEKNPAENHPPAHFLCPISSDCMYDPVLVNHNGFEYRFDRTSLEAHAQTRYRDNNPLTNESGFAEAVIAGQTDTNLQKEIQESQWAPEKPEPIFIDEEKPEDNEAFRVVAIEFRLPSAWSWSGRVWPHYGEGEEERMDTIEERFRFYFGDNNLLG